MHISHATVLVTCHQPLTMEAWGQVYLQALSLSLGNTFPQKMSPSEAAVALRHDLKWTPSTWSCFYCPLCTVALSQRKPASAKISWRNELFQKNKHIHNMSTGYIKSPTTRVSQGNVSYKVTIIKTNGCWLGTFLMCTGLHERSYSK